MIERYYKEDNDAEYVETEEYGIIKLSDLPITLNDYECHKIRWAKQKEGENKGKHVLAETTGCSPFTYEESLLSVVRVVGVDLAGEYEQ